MKTISKILTAAFVLCCANKSFAQASSATTANATATIVTPIKITWQSDMQFGEIAVHATTDGEVELTTDGDRNPSGGVTLPASTKTVSAAKFKIEGDGTRSFSIAFPSSITLKDNNGTGSNTMEVTGVTSSLGSSAALDGGVAELKMGGTLEVTAAQEPGDYSGEFEVTVEYE